MVKRKAFSPVQLEKWQSNSTRSIILAKRFIAEGVMLSKASHTRRCNNGFVVPYLVQLLQAIEALYIRVKLKHSASKGGRLLSGIAWRCSAAFRTIKASAVRAFVGMAHHSYNRILMLLFLEDI